MERWPVADVSLTPLRRREWTAPMILEWTDRVVGRRSERRMEVFRGVLLAIAFCAALVVASALGVSYDILHLAAGAIALGTVGLAVRLARARRPVRQYSMILDLDRVRVTMTGPEGVKTAELGREEAGMLRLTRLGFLELCDGSGEIRIRLRDTEVATPPAGPGAGGRSKLRALVGDWWPDRDMRERAGEPWA